MKDRERFGEIVRNLFRSEGISFEQASIRCEHGMEQSLFSRMGRGHVPRFDTLHGNIERVFPNRNLAALYRAGGYEPPVEHTSDGVAERPLYHFLEPGEVDWLEAEATRRGVEPGVILREAVREYHDRREE